MKMQHKIFQARRFMKYVPTICGGVIGIVLGTTGITWMDWQLYAILILSGAGSFAGFSWGWMTALDDAERIIKKFGGTHEKPGA